MSHPFTESARRCMVIAQQEARQLGNRQVGTEHLLLGILGEGSSVAARILRSHGVELHRVRQGFRPLGPSPETDEMVFSEGVRRALEGAFTEARATGSIAPEHLLLGLLEEGSAARRLARLPADPDGIRRDLLRLVRRACPRCREIAGDAGRCPHCGLRRRGLPPWAWLAAACLLVLVAPVQAWMERLAGWLQRL